MRLIYGFGLIGLGSGEIYEDIYPYDCHDMSKLFQTLKFQEEKIDIPAQKVPEWIDGVFYRNGPSKYEYGENTKPEFDHFFDPTAALQAITIKNGKIEYQSRITESSRYKDYTAAGKVCRPEVGTYREDEWVTTEWKGEPIKDFDPLKDAKIMANRVEFLLDVAYATDNTNIAVHSLHGYLFSFTETTFINYHDPVTLETLGTFNLREAGNFPEDVFCQTQTAHGHFDASGTFWNVMACLEKPDSDWPAPHVAYIPFKIPNARRTGPNQFDNPMPKQEFLDSIVFGDPFYNTQKYEDFAIHYHHMTSITQKYVVIPLNSLKIDMTKTVTNTLKEAKPLTSNMIYDPEAPGAFVIYSMEEMKEVGRVETDPFFIVHMINAYDDVKEDGTETVVLDSTNMINGDILEVYFYDRVNVTGSALLDEYEKNAPYGYTQRYTIEMPLDPENPKNVSGVGLFDNHPDNDNFECYMKGGVEFPILNFAKSDGLPYDHWWGAGFGAILPDRLYHIQWSTLERRVWMEPEYSPGEPVFVQKPDGDEDEGVLLSLVSSFARDDLPAFIVVLDARSMEEITRAELPSDLSIPVGFHSLWIDLTDYCSKDCEKEYVKCVTDCSTDTSCLSQCSRSNELCLTDCKSTQ